MIENAKHNLAIGGAEYKKTLTNAFDQDIKTLTAEAASAK
jgi:hypothetical protein